MKKAVSLISALLICFSFTACVSDREYKELEQRVSRIEDTINISPASNNEAASSDEEVTQEVETETQKESRNDFYDISGMTVSEIVDLCMFYLDNVPRQNQTFEDYAASFKVEPYEIKPDNGLYGGDFNFYNNNDDVPSVDRIKKIMLWGIITEMDGSIGINKNTYEGHSVKITLDIIEYSKASEIYSALYDNLAQYYDVESDNREGTSWKSFGRSRIAPDSNDTLFLRMEKYDSYYTIQAGKEFAME